MRVQGKIFKKRPYLNSENKNINCIAFMEMSDGVEINGDHVKIIPILINDAELKHIVGENIEVDGEIRFERILTMTGIRSLHPIPVLQVYSIWK
ncbi:hypothetical protein [Ammoniphilus sp. 3BR4]|uniref:hypothetical protein n=1 Tax=Ammoniphilus sp. 3BR4 TaxID=3158265 RepID=UPI003466F0EC